MNVVLQINTDSYESPLNDNIIPTKLTNKHPTNPPLNMNSFLRDIYYPADLMKKLSDQKGGSKAGGVKLNPRALDMALTGRNKA